MLIKKIFFSLVLFMIIFINGQAGALTIDFEDVAVAPGTMTLIGDVISRGFLFQCDYFTTNYCANLANNYNLGGTSSSIDNGGTFIVLNNRLSPQGPPIPSVMEAVSGEIFSLTSIDFSEFGDPIDQAARWINVTGYLSGGGTVSQLVTLDGLYDGPGGINDFQTEIFNWSSLTKVEFLGSGSNLVINMFGLDNAVVTVPEPATMLLFGSGLFGLWGLRRKFIR